LETERVLDDLLAHLNHRYDILSGQHVEDCREAYRNNLLGYQKWLVFRYEGKVIRARITGVSETGLLQLSDEHSVQFECDFKEIEFLF
jgi:biotin-(acetyl-CoA carboxylase) ligase